MCEHYRNQFEADYSKLQPLANMQRYGDTGQYVDAAVWRAWMLVCMTVKRMEVE